MSKNITSEMFLLEINKEKCKDCGACEKLLPQFKNIYNGKISISAWAYQRDDVKMGVKSVIDRCSEKAISFSKVV